MNMNLNAARWSWKELLYVLLLTLVAVPVFIEYGLFHFLLGFFGNELYAGTATGLSMSLIFLSGLYWIVLKPNRQSWKALGVQSFASKHWKFILWWTAVLIVLSILLVIVMSFFGIGTANSKTDSLQAQMTLLNFMIAFVSAAIISPIYEEIFYRGFLYRFFSSRFGVLAGLLISAAIFTLVHIPTYNTLPVNFVSGLIFAWAFQKTGSVIPGILIHGTFNGIAIILTSIA
ncbi:CPBP family intramembrane glutamic endopeptidase [Planococcus ruber]|uniref:CPBP family intramembrane glutamic endopeptidase n=1 Tax=Planococcus ruber TaxID=2027871 RepID=UPI001FED841F|nr:type II CAAX endopeptidase family protein [Planococcus ruber]MCJ1907657.1 CPBP family intramembrane metalloprotease [Planococcus ruber]